MHLSHDSWSRPRALSLFVAVGVASAFVAGGAGTDKGAGSSLEDYLKRNAYLPVTLKKGEHESFLVEGMLGGKKRLFEVDTGCSWTTLNEGTARGLKTLGQLEVALEDSFWGKLSDPSIVLMDKLTLGHAQFLNQPARVKDLRLDFISVGFDGLLGCDFFFRNYCIVDCLDQRLYVRGTEPSADATSAVETTLRRSGFTEVPLDVKYGSMNVAAKVNDEPVKLLVDTGATCSMLDSALAKRLRLSAVKHEELGSHIKREWSALAVGLGEIGANKMWITTLRTFEMGSPQWTNVHLGVVDLKSWGLAKPGSKGEGVQGVLGREMLTARGALIDYHSRKLWFRPEKARN